VALAIVLAGQQPVPAGRSCALTFDQPQSLSVTETLVRVPCRIRTADCSLREAHTRVPIVQFVQVLAGEWTIVAASWQDVRVDFQPGWG
jgi:hypothetical protein